MQRGERFREARERVGLSQGQVAEYVDTGQGYISDIENGKRWPSTWALLDKLAQKYRVSVDWLFGIAADELPSFGREVLGIMERLSEGRREELYHHAMVLDEAELRERNEHQAAMYLDRAEAMGDDVLDALLTALDLAKTDGRPAAEAFIRSFWAEKAKDMTEEDLHDS